jgi:hypothetical protein
MEEHPHLRHRVAAWTTVTKKTNAGQAAILFPGVVNFLYFFRVAAIRLIV